MIAAMKAKLRAWLIDLVREAIRLEEPRVPFVVQTPLGESKFAGQMSNDMVTGSFKSRSGVITPQQAQVIHADPSFEQMQAEAIREQEKYYEVAK